jgi:hypothetical protein
LTGVVFATAKLIPESPIFRAGAIGRIDEHAVVMTANFFQRVADYLEEILVRVDDLAIEAEFDNRLDTVERGHAPLHLPHRRAPVTSSSP